MWIKYDLAYTDQKPWQPKELDAAVQLSPFLKKRLSL